jgi:hypothetical protein
MGKGMEMGRSVYEQPGTEVDRILSQQGGFQVSKGKRKGAKRQKARGLHHNYIVFSTPHSNLSALRQSIVAE